MCRFTRGSERVLLNGKWASRQACIKRRSFCRRFSFVFPRPPYKALLDAFVFILGILRQTFLCLTSWGCLYSTWAEERLGFKLILGGLLYTQIEWEIYVSLGKVLCFIVDFEFDSRCTVAATSFGLIGHSPQSSNWLTLYLTSSQFCALGLDKPHGMHVP